MTVPAQHIHIGRPQRAQQHLVPHRSAIHEQELRHSRTTRIGRQGRIAGKMEPIPLRVDRQGVLSKLLAQNRTQATVQCIKHVTSFGIRAERHTAVATGHVRQSEGDKGFGHGEALDHICDRLIFSAICAQEFQTRRCGVKQIAQFNHSTFRQGCRFHRRHRAASDLDFSGFALRPACYGQPTHGAQRRQSFPPKPKTVDVQQVRAIDL